MDMIFSSKEGGAHMAKPHKTLSKELVETT
jgi:hypothetical protein